MILKAVVASKYAIHTMIQSGVTVYKDSIVHVRRRPQKLYRKKTQWEEKNSAGNLGRPGNHSQALNGPSYEATQEVIYLEVNALKIIITKISKNKTKFISTEASA